MRVPAQPQRVPGPASQQGWGPQYGLGYGEPLEGDPVYLQEPYPPQLGPVGYGSYPYGPPPRPAAEVRTDLRSEPVVGWLLAVVGVLTMIAATMPWATAYGLDFHGTSGDGVITLVCGLVVGVAGLLTALGHGVLGTSITSLVFSAIIALIAVVDLTNSSDMVRNYHEIVVLGAGLWLTLITGLLAVALSVVALVRRGMVAGR